MSEAKVVEITNGDLRPETGDQPLLPSPKPSTPAGAEAAGENN